MSYPDLVLLAGGTFVSAPVDDSAEPDIAALERAITNKTRGIILNTPNNPTGAVYSRARLEELVSVRARAQSLDPLRRDLRAARLRRPIPRITGDGGSEGLARTIVASGFSKSYAMTGWRLRILGGAEGDRDGGDDDQGQVTSSVNTPTQWAALAALRACGETNEK